MPAAQAAKRTPSMAGNTGGLEGAKGEILSKAREDRLMVLFEFFFGQRRRLTAHGRILHGPLDIGIHDLDL